MAPPAPEAHGQHAVVLRQVHKAFGSVTALHSVDLQIKKNEFFSILGPSGCGKTTLMRMVAGFDEPTSGSIELDGRPVAGLAPHRRDLNMLFQSYALFPHLSVAQNVGFELSVRRVPKAEAARRVAEALELVRMGEFGARRPNQLSGGQRQRVALARAVVGRPAVVLLDEPLAALDLKLRQEMQLELKRMQRETGITFVYVTHDQGEALTMSDRIAVFDKGRLEQVASPRELYEAPATGFVARFIGTSTVLRGTGTGTAVRVDGLGELATATRTTPGGTYDAVLRPEDITVTRLSSQLDARAAAPALRGRVSEVIYQGSIVKLLIDLPGGAVLTAEDSPARLDPGLRPGDEVAWSSVPHRTALLHVSDGQGTDSTPVSTLAPRPGDADGPTAGSQDTAPSTSTIGGPA